MCFFCFVDRQSTIFISLKNIYCISTKLGDGADGNRSYDWIIKKTLPKNAAQDKETFITVDLGTKLAR